MGKLGRRARKPVKKAADHFLKPFQMQTVKTDFKKRKQRAERHPYQTCFDLKCPRPLCKAFKEGIQNCPLSHG